MADLTDQQASDMGVEAAQLLGAQRLHQELLEAVDLDPGDDRAEFLVDIEDFLDDLVRHGEQGLCLPHDHAAVDPRPHRDARRGAGVLLGARRIEHRVAGGDVNPYLMLAAILGAALDGQTARLDQANGLAFAVGFLVGMGAMCPKCGSGTRRTSKHSLPR